jgi:hypothetical protein
LVVSSFASLRWLASVCRGLSDDAGAREGEFWGGPRMAAAQFGWVGLEGRLQWRQHLLFKRCANLAAAQ